MEKDLVVVVLEVVEHFVVRKVQEDLVDRRIIIAQITFEGK